MKLRLLSTLGASVLATSAIATAQVASDTFDSANDSGWAVDFNTVGTWDAAFGNPGGGIQVTVQSPAQVFASRLITPTVAGSGWSGNYRALGVDGFSYDRMVEVGSSNFGTRMNLVLGSDGGTPGNYSDDALIFVETGDIFQFGSQPWATFNTPIPSQDINLPAGWSVEITANSPLAMMTDDEAWNAIIEDVSYLALATQRPLGGGAWFGAHIIRYDNMELGQGTPLGTNYCSPGVANSSGQPGIISATGSASVAVNAFTLQASDLPANQFGIFLNSRTEAFVVGANGTSDGNLCLGGAIGRFNLPNQILSSGPSGSFSLAIDLNAIPTPTSFVPVIAGETWRFQCWHRDFSPLGSNFTDAIRVPFSS